MDASQARAPERYSQSRPHLAGSRDCRAGAGRSHVRGLWLLHRTLLAVSHARANQDLEARGRDAADSPRSHIGFGVLLRPIKLCLMTQSLRFSAAT